MKIVLISPFLFRHLRGIERFTVEVANSFSKQGVDVHIITWKENKAWPWGPLETNVHLHTVCLPKYFRSFFAGIIYPFILRKLRPDVTCILFAWHGENIAFRLAPEFLASTCLILHYPAEQVPHRYRMMEKCFLVKHAKVIVGVSDYVAEQAAFLLNRKIPVISSGVNPEEFCLAKNTNKKDLRAKLGLPLDMKIILTIAAFEKRKGIDYCIDVIDQVRQSHPDVLYLVLGDGPEAKKLKKHVEMHRLEKHVKFGGAVTNTSDYYLASDIFLFLSKGEGSPLALLEAMSSGLPLVLADNPPLNQMAAQNGAHYVKREEIGKVCQVVSDLLDSSDKRLQMGKANREQAVKKYAWSVIANEYLKLFRDCFDLGKEEWQGIRKRPLKIAIISPFLFRYFRGIERSSIHLANELAARGHKVDLYTWSGDLGCSVTAVSPEVKLIKSPRFRYFQAILVIPFYLYWFLKNDYDAVNIYFSDCGEALPLKILRYIKKTKINFIVGYPFEHTSHRFKKFKFLRFDKAIDGIVVKTGPMAQGVASFFGRKVQVIPNGIDHQKFKPQDHNRNNIRKMFGIYENECVLLTVSALEVRKGIQHVIRAVRKMVDENIPVRYWIVGAGPYYSKLHRLVQKLNLNSHVHFVTEGVDILPYYALADIFILLSKGEGFPNVILEAFAMELPVIVSRHVPYPDLVTKETGFLVDETNAEELGRAIKKLLNSQNLRKEMGRTGRIVVEEKYCWGTIAEKYIDLFYGQISKLGDERTTKNFIVKLRQWIKSGQFLQWAKGLLVKFGLSVVNAIVPQSFKGKVCSICGWKGVEFFPVVSPWAYRPGAQCPKCRSLERHRGLVQLFEDRRLLRKGMKCLDIGPWLGLKKYLLEAGVSCVTIDRGFIPADSVMDVCHLGIRDEAFDLVICFHVLEYVEGWEKAIKELYRCLKKGGILILSEFSDRELQKTEKKDPRKVITGTPIMKFGRDFFLCLEQAGFKVEAHNYVIGSTKGADWIYICTKADA
ncbi:MAG: glycosyltransferase [Candidatus Omnitrophica bacterium]|nr:glycosyltransferase [Candidatus Omnitrophota bacterium]